MSPWSSLSTICKYKKRKTEYVANESFATSMAHIEQVDHEKIL